jgi:hypothetical protein
METSVNSIKPCPVTEVWKGENITASSGSETLARYTQLWGCLRDDLSLIHALIQQVNRLYKKAAPNQSAAFLIAYYVAININSPSSI